MTFSTELRILSLLRLFERDDVWLAKPDFLFAERLRYPFLQLSAENPLDLYTFLDWLNLDHPDPSMGNQLVKAVHFVHLVKPTPSLRIFFDPSADSECLKNLVARLDAYGILLKSALPKSISDQALFHLEVDGQPHNNNIDWERSNSFEIVQNIPPVEQSKMRSSKAHKGKRKAKGGSKKAKPSEISIILMKLQVQNVNQPKVLIQSFLAVLNVKKPHFPKLRSIKFTRQTDGTISISITVLEGDLSPGINWPRIIDLVLDYSGIERHISEDEVDEGLELKVKYHNPKALEGGWIFCQGTKGLYQRTIFRKLLEIEHLFQVAFLPQVGIGSLMKPGLFNAELVVDHEEMLSFRLADRDAKWLWRKLSELVLGPLCPAELLSVVAECERGYCLLILSFSHGNTHLPFTQALRELFAAHREASVIDGVEILPQSPLYHIYTQEADGQLMPVGNFASELIELFLPSSESPVIVHLGPLPSSIVVNFVAELQSHFTPALLTERLLGSMTALRLTPGKVELLIMGLNAYRSLPTPTPSSSTLFKVGLIPKPWYFFERGELGFELRGADLDEADGFQPDGVPWIMTQSTINSDTLNQVELMVMHSSHTVASLTRLARENQTIVIAVHFWRSPNQSLSFTVICRHQHRSIVEALFEPLSFLRPALRYTLMWPQTINPIISSSGHESELLPLEEGHEWSLHLSQLYPELAKLSNPIPLLANLSNEFLEADHETLLLIVPTSPSDARKHFHVTFKIDAVADFFAHLVSLLPRLPKQHINLFGDAKGAMKAIFFVTGDLTDAYAQTDCWLRFGKRMQVVAFYESNPLDSSKTATLPAERMIQVKIGHSSGVFSDSLLMHKCGSFFSYLQVKQPMEFKLMDLPVSETDLPSLLHLEASIASLNGNEWSFFLAGFLRHLMEMKQSWSLTPGFTEPSKLDSRLMQITFHVSAEGVITLRIAMLSSKEGLAQAELYLADFFRRSLLIRKLPVVSINQPWELRYWQKQKRLRLQGDAWSELLEKSRQIQTHPGQELILTRTGEKEASEDLELTRSAVNLSGLNVTRGAWRLLGFAYRFLLIRLKAFKIRILGDANYEITLRFGKDVELMDSQLSAFLEYLDQAPPSSTKIKLANHAFAWTLNGQPHVGPLRIQSVDDELKPVESSIPSQVEVLPVMTLIDKTPVALPVNKNSEVSKPVAPLARSWTLAVDGGAEVAVNSLTDFELAWPENVCSSLLLSLASQYLQRTDERRYLKFEFFGDEPPYEAALALMRHALETKEIYHRSILAVSLESGDYQEGGSADDHVFDDEAFFEYYKFHREEDVEDREEENDTGYSEEELVEMTRWLTLYEENQERLARRKRRRLKKEGSKGPAPVKKCKENESEDENEAVGTIISGPEAMEFDCNSIQRIPCWADESIKDQDYQVPVIPSVPPPPATVEVPENRWILSVHVRSEIDDTKWERLEETLATLIR